ncbi:MAG: PKD domain-containing protein [Bacteroidota bacterium]
MKNVLNKAGILSLIILAISFLGCEDDDDNTTGLPTVVAAFTQTQIQNSGIVSFINISENADSFSWDFGDGTTSTEKDPIKMFEEGTFTVTLTASNVSGASNTFSDELTIVLPDQFDSGLLTNGDFENGADPWFTNFGDNIPEVRVEGGNGFFFANVETANPMQPFVVNLSQVLEITEGTNYILSFTASSDQERTILAGIGLNEAPFTSTDAEITLTTTPQTFMLQFAASDFGGANSRVLFDLAGAVGTVVLDNIALVVGGDGSDSDTGGTGGGTGSITECSGGTLINDFESDDDSIFSNFGGGVGTIIDNPDTSVNTSAKVGQYVKNSGDDFGGITIALDSNIALDNGVFSIDVNSQAVRQLLFKLEGINVELTTATSGMGWETLEYDFDGDMGEVTGITLIMDNGTVGDGSGDFTILFDNIRLCSNGGSGGASLVECSGGTLINDFETDDNSIFTNFGGGEGTIIDNLDTSVNTSAKVGQYVKNSGDDFGGITIALDSNIDLNNGVFSIDVSSQAVRQLLFKLEGINVELTTATSGAGWETIEYDFNGDMGEVTGITLIMDNGTVGDGSGDFTILFDNIRLCSNDSTGGGGTGSQSPFCETNIFLNGNSAETASAAILTIANVDAQSMIVTIESADSDPVDDLVVNAFGGDITGSPAISAIDSSVPGQLSRTLTWTGTPPANVDLNVLWSKVATGAGLFQLANTNSTIPFDATCSPSGGGGSGGGCTATPTDATSLPATFEACETFLGTFTNDGSITTELAANPSATGLNTSANVLRINKAIGTSRFAGVQNAFPNADVIGDLASTTLKVLVYSDRANVSYRFGVNNNPNLPGVGLPGEVTVVAAAANEWVELEVTFTGIPANFEANQLVIKPDNPTGINDTDLTTEDGVFYIDNIRIE